MSDINGVDLLFDSVLHMKVLCYLPYTTVPMRFRYIDHLADIYNDNQKLVKKEILHQSIVSGRMHYDLPFALVTSNIMHAMKQDD